MPIISKYGQRDASCSSAPRANSSGAWLLALYLWLASFTLFLAPSAASAASFAVDTATAPMSGLWWNSAEPGWGLSIEQQGPVMFVGWYTYDQSGNSTRYFLSNCAVSGDGCSGSIYAISGGAAPTAPWTGHGPVTTVGSGTLSFSDVNTGVFNFVLNGVNGSKNIARNVFGATVAPPAIDYTALWWNPSESGWGLFISHQSPNMFAILFTYDAQGNALRYVASNCVVSGNGCTGTLYKTSGGSAPTSPWTGSVALTPVGTFSVTFADGSNGTVSFTIDGQSGSKTISKMIFYAAPVISGTITTTSGNALAGVTVSTTGANAVTNGGGNYALAGLANGTYTITPSLSGYTFSPSSRTPSLNGADVPNQDFVATVNPVGSGSGAYRATGGGQDIVVTGDIQDLSREFTLHGECQGCVATLYYHPTDSRHGTVNTTFSGSGVTGSTAGTYSISGPDGGVLTLTQTTYGCVDNIPGSCRTNTEIITLTPI